MKQEETEFQLGPNQYGFHEKLFTVILWWFYFIQKLETLCFSSL